MTLRDFSIGRFSCLLRLALSIVLVTTPSSHVLAQGATQAVRQRVQGLGSAGEPQPYPTEQPAYAEHDTTLLADPLAGMIDTTYVAPNAAILLVLRPAQILAAPVAELLPTEVFSAAGMQYMGVDPAQVDEAIAFVDLSNPLGPAYGLTIKFNQPFRAASIPPERHAHAQLAELGGKKYLQSANPMLYSLYGPNSQTLVLAPDATLRQLVESRGQPKSGPVIDRVRNVPAGSDLYLAIDVTSLRPMIQLGMSQIPADVPDEAKPLLELPNLIAAAELTFNMSNAGPTSLIIHANDDSAAQQLETMLLELMNRYEASPEAASAMNDPIAQAMTRYRERISQPFRPQRSGASITVFHLDGQNPAQRQLVSTAVVGLALLAPALEAAANAAQMNQMNQTDEAAEMPEAPDGEFSY